MKQLTGKIFWVKDDFAYFGKNVMQNDKSEHAVSNVNYATIQPHMIKFQTDPVDYSGDLYAYNVNLTINERGSHYTGFFSEINDSDCKGEVKCEVFENDKAYFIYGDWKENDEYYTWWARVEK